MIYDYFFTRICLGFYQEGDTLPSIGEAREMFGVSTRTIRKAYHMLEEGGYLSISRGRNAVVIRGGAGRPMAARCASPISRPGATPSSTCPGWRKRFCRRSSCGGS